MPECPNLWCLKKIKDYPAFWNTYGPEYLQHISMMATNENIEKGTISSLPSMLISICRWWGIIWFFTPVPVVIKLFHFSTNDNVNKMI